MDASTMRFIRTSKGLNVSQFAKKIGVSVALVCRIEGGDRRLTERVEGRILHAFGITEEKLAAMNVLISVIKN